MNIELVKEILDKLDSSQHKKLVFNLIKNAVRYAHLRVDWYLADLTNRFEIDVERTRAHNAFIDSCNILSRNMQLSNEDISWRALIGNDRKQIGDFACFIHAIIGIKAR